MKFKKSCFECGNKVDILYEGMCENCFRELNPPIEEIKPINLKICNMCRKVHYNNHFYTIDEIEQMLTNIVEKRLILNENYNLDSLEIANFEVKGHKLSFDVEVECYLKN